MFFKNFLFPHISIEIERWKYCVALDIYVSNMGRFKDRNGQPLSVCKKDGYLYCKGKPAHRLVMQTWKPIPGYAKLTVDHKDHNTWNNKLSNLEWVTVEENVARDKADKEANAPVITSTTTIKTEKMFLVNKVAMTLDAAKAMLKNDKSLSGTANIDRAFEKAISKNGEMKFGNYTIQYVRGK